jgi:hypothetical protein
MVCINEKKAISDNLRPPQLRAARIDPYCIEPGLDAYEALFKVTEVPVCQ